MPSSKAKRSPSQGGRVEDVSSDESSGNGCLPGCLIVLTMIFGVLWWFGMILQDRSSLYLAIFVAASLAFLWVMFRLFRPRRGSTPDGKPGIGGYGTYSTPVVGAGSYQRNLTKLAGGKKRDAANLDVTASLVFEDENPHDDAAVRVDVEGLTVGYLDRANARKYRAYMLESKPDVDVLRCRARIVGGWKRSKDDEGHFGVRLDMILG